MTAVVNRRGAVAGLESACPVLRGLPAIYHEHEFVRRFTAAFDEALAPVFTTLDCLEAYLDPALAPDDFVSWLAHWVGVAEQLPINDGRRRRLVASAVRLYPWRGTVRGVRETVRLLTGAEPQLVEPGQPGSSGPYAIVLKVLRTPGLDVAQLRAVVATGIPAHLTWRIEFTEPEERTAPIRGAAEAPRQPPAAPAPGRARPPVQDRAWPPQPPEPPRQPPQQPPGGQ